MVQYKIKIKKIKNNTQSTKSKNKTNKKNPLKLNICNVLPTEHKCVEISIVKEMLNRFLTIPTNN